jgi:hypothetical protein
LLRIFQQANGWVRNIDCPFFDFVDNCKMALVLMDNAGE